MAKTGAILMQKYEVGRLLGQGSFAKVYYARSLESGQSVAIKAINKEKILKVGLINHIKREISVMRLVQHPNVVKLYEVMATKTNIYFVMEYVKGGELFNKISKGRLKVGSALKYFQQLISAVDFCHSRGVYHRDLKPENLLLDENGGLKVSDFGLSALCESRRQDGLLHTTCGTPAYVAPEVITKKGYDGAKADIWACGVVLYVLLAGFLPFHDPNLMQMYKKICRGDFRCPQWFPSEVRKLLSKILDPNPRTRISLSKIMQNSWVKKGFESLRNASSMDQEENDVSTPRDVRESFNLHIESGSQKRREGNQGSSSEVKANGMNAFDIISLSSGFNLSNLFEKDANHVNELRLASNKPTSTIVSKLEEIAETERFNIRKKDGVVKLQSNRAGRKGLLAIEAGIFEIAPSLHMVELKKASGDTLEYVEFCDQGLKPALKDIAWTWEGGEPQNQNKAK